MSFCIHGKQVFLRNFALSDVEKVFKMSRWHEAVDFRSGLWRYRVLEKAGYFFRRNRTGSPREKADGFVDLKLEELDIAFKFITT